ncbi:DDE-type integrase/transposase/recombinase [Teichococcus wenyumeiae]|uniref:DDE-type integrase/transposase/recombinase n=1 Tax=Teichococcus wenyumeiae TaxID=2478470 RepID=UPI0013146886|nr:DDE-type integrase/transposase/recombinase [Pseudoroseomonas wenyumeiae]
MWHVDETYLKARGHWCYLYRAMDRNGDLVDTMLSEHRDMAAAEVFFRPAKSASGMTPDRATTDEHGSYPRAIHSTLGEDVKHRTSAFKNNRLEQGHRGIKGRIRCMRGFKHSVRRSGSVEDTTNSVHFSVSAVYMWCSPFCKQHGSAAYFGSRRADWLEIRKNR